MSNFTNAKGEKVSPNWTAGPSELLRCPVEGCTHTGEIITKAHCRMAHNMTRDEVKKQYGMPVIVEGKGAILSENNGRKWNSVGGTYLI